MPTDIILYAIVAAVMIFWLRSVLGTRHGEERERPNPFEEKPETDKTASGNTLPPIDVPYSRANKDIPVGDDGIDKGLVQIALADKDFDLRRFKENAEDAFTIIVIAFAEGDRDTLRDLCMPAVYDAFDAAIAAREKSGETVSTEIHAVRKMEVADAGVMNKKTAFVTLRITADETYVVADKQGKIISGHPDRVTEMTDKWTFSRDVKSRDPRWFLSKAEDDVIEEDGKTPMPDAG